MVRFTCPGCGAPCSPENAKPGDTAKCPNCGAGCIVPPADAPVEIEPCPGCAVRLSVAPTDVGVSVECPYCKSVFDAVAVVSVPTLPVSKPEPRREEPRRPRRERSESPSPGTPSNVTAIAAMLLGGGIYALIQDGAIVLGSSGVCCLWPGVILSLVWAVLAIIRGSAMLGGRDEAIPPRTLLILQIVMIVNFDVVNLVLGIVGLALLNNPQVRDYYAARELAGEDHMIRFACPGCGATYSVDDAKAGKTGKCPKCQSQFVIPAGEAGPPPLPSTAEAPPPLPKPEPPPPVIDPNAAVEIAPCPGCQARLSVSASDLGVNVECPYCKTIYTAARSNAAISTSPPSAPKRAPVDPFAGAGAAKKNDFAFDDEDDRPSRRARRDEEDDYDDRPSRKKSRRRDEEDDYDDRPRKKKKKSRYSDVESKRITAGILALLLGAYGVHKFYLGYSGAGVIQLIITFVTCGLAGIIPFVEGIMYLTKSDEDFIETYQVGQKEWF